MHPRLKAKIPKMLEWRRAYADWYVWMDSSVRLKENIDIPHEIIKIANGKPLCLFRHTRLSSIQEEAVAIQQAISQGVDYHIRRYSGEPLIDQVKSYLNDKSFSDTKLFQMTFFAYHKSAAPLMQEWFLHNCIWSIEDQISFPYVLNKSGLQYSCFEGNALNNNIFTWDWKLRERNLSASK
ncbi:glycosyltransferase domain-containing protein [Synechococcus sp. 1G10]|uniref:glycosyltransferase domain-containing protein n=1 Tax=Synechococcus sp. 1G10 TaxID=2025605 RepID=UPI000B98A3E4|nr:glycosyltransferase domain-containing protein [Synechococcus sp. 1G10]